jgi:hypothetical protein
LKGLKRKDGKSGVEATSSTVHSPIPLTLSTFSKSVIESEKLQLKNTNVRVSWVAIDRMAGEESYFQTKDRPDEKGVILKRVRERKSQGLLDNYFEQYEHIICCNHGTRILLEKMKGTLEIEKKKNKVVLETH